MRRTGHKRRRTGQRSENGGENESGFFRQEDRICRKIYEVLEVTQIMECLSNCKRLILCSVLSVVKSFCRSWDAKGLACPTLGYERAAARERASKPGGMTSVSSDVCGGAALVWDSHAPKRRRCAPEAWDDTAVIPPFGSKRAGARLRFPLCNQINLTSLVAGLLLNTPLF